MSSLALVVARPRSVLRDYVTLTKPKVQSLLLFTTVTTMYVAGTPSVGLVFLTCLGGAFSAGGAGAVNHYVDRDIAATMSRTATRPVPAGGDSPRARFTVAGARGAPPCARVPPGRGAAGARAA